MTVTIGDWFDLPRGSVTKPTFAISDIHGHLKPLERLLGHVSGQITTPSRLIFVGDYVDRGPHPTEVMQRVRAGLGRPDVEEIILRGNHDQYLIDALDGDSRTLDTWLTYGGEDTFEALGIPISLSGSALTSALSASIDPELTEWLHNLPLLHEADDVVFVHAGLTPERSLAKQTPNDLMWIRGTFLDCPMWEWPFEKLVVHGHTPYAFGPAPHRIGIDSGCYSTGVLTALELNGARGRFHQTVP